MKNKLDDHQLKALLFKELLEENKIDGPETMELSDGLTLELKKMLADQDPLPQKRKKIFGWMNWRVGVATLCLSLLLLSTIIFPVQKTWAHIKHSIETAQRIFRGGYQKQHFKYSVMETESETILSIDLLDHSAIIFGRELWKKGETIKIYVDSCEDSKKTLDVGIILCEDVRLGWSYDSYGYPIIKTIELDGQEMVVEIQVPETGEYGIYFMDKTKKYNLLSFFKIKDKEEVVKERGKSSKESVVKKFNTKKPHSEFQLRINRLFLNPLSK